MIRIGIVDDHQLFIDGIKSIIDTEVDIEIVASLTSGTEYVKNYGSDHIDITLTDIRMPEIDGLTVCRSIIKKNPKAKIVILSMYDQPADIREAIKAKASGYLPKNIDRAELISAIRAIYNGLEVFPESYDQYVSEQKYYKGTYTTLTKREQEILILIAKGRTSQEIATELHLSKFTVDTHRKNIHKKLNLDGSAALIKYAVEHYK